MNIEERDFQISAPTVVPTGRLILRVRNEGPDSHELIVVRTNGGLPLRDDGITVDEERLQTVSAIRGALEPGDPGSVRDLHLNLTPGRYEMFCNMAGHYMGGMHREIVVR